MKYINARDVLPDELVSRSAMYRALTSTSPPVGRGGAGARPRATAPSWTGATGP